MDGLQALARSCTDVRLVFCALTTSHTGSREIPLAPAEKAELLSLILKMEPVKDDHCIEFVPEFTIKILFTMPNGSVQYVSYPKAVGRRSVSSDGYAFMSSCALPNADAARWHKLAKHDWILKQLQKGKAGD